MAKGEGKQSAGPGAGRSARPRSSGSVDFGSEFSGTSSQELMAYKAHAIKVLDKLPQEEKQAISAFTGSSYQYINELLRRGSTLYGDEPKMKDLIAKMDTAFNRKEVKLPRDVVLYRMVSVSHPIYSDLVRGQLQVGKVYSDKGFQSTSIHKGKWDGDVTFRIKAKKGAKALHVETISYHQSERETLLPRDAKFKVTGFETQGAKLFVDVDYE